MHKRNQIAGMLMSDDELMRLGWDLERLHMIVATQTFQYAATMFDGEMSLPRMVALSHLSFRGPQTITSLANAVSLSHAATSRMVDGLVKVGLVSRHEGAQDRRQKLVELNAAGRECIQAFRTVAAQGYADLMGGMSEQSRAGLASALADILGSLPPLPPMS